MNVINYAANESLVGEGGDIWIERFKKMIILLGLRGGRREGKGRKGLKIFVCYQLILFV